MTPPGRNDPCPCGSAKKYKHCCWGSERTPPSPALAAAQEFNLRRLTLHDRLTRFARQRFGSEWLAVVLATYFGGEFEDWEAEEEMPLWQPWSLFEFETRGAPVARWLLEERSSGLDAADRACVEAELASWTSLWEVRGVEPSLAVVLADLLTGQERRVVDANASGTLRRWEVLLGRVVDQGGFSVIGGAHPQPLPPQHAERALQAARRNLGVRSRKVSVAELKSARIEVGLLFVWRLLVEDVRDPALPPLANTDGDPVLLTVDHFDFEPAQRARVVERLAALDEADREDFGDGTTRVTLLRAPTSPMAIGDRVMVATAVVGSQRLQLETHSQRRADDARRAVEGACAGLLQHRVRQHTDPRTLIRRGEAPRATREPLAVPAPERARILANVKARHYAKWPDQQLLALGGKTPREAARTPAGRRKLEALLKQMEYRESFLPQEERFHLAALREALGVGEKE